MVSERLERLLDSLVMSMRENQRCGLEVDCIINNMRNEIKVLASAEEAAFHLWLANQYTKESINA